MLYAFYGRKPWFLTAFITFYAINILTVVFVTILLTALGDSVAAMAKLVSALSLTVGYDLEFRYFKKRNYLFQEKSGAGEKIPVD
jgi:hypothetical protein